jgi:hypothetical protein
MLVYSYAFYFFPYNNVNTMFENCLFSQKSMLALDDRSHFYKKGIKDSYEIFPEVINPANSVFRSGLLRRSTIL